jgi:hypothetical protein
LDFGREEVNEIEMTTTPSVSPVATAQTATTGITHWGGKGKGKGEKWASLFSSALASAANNSTLTGSTALSSTANTASNGVVSQLTSLLQQGTPISSVVNQIAQSVGASAAKMLQGTYANGDVNQLRTSITQTIANALSPPSNAPPGDAAQEAAALAARLRQVVASIAGDADSESGQQNELSGNILDASTAKEAPAQQQNGTNAAASTLDVDGLVRALLSSAISALNTPASTASSTAAQTAAAAAQQAQMSALVAPSVTPAQPPASTTQQASPSVYAPQGQPPQPSLTMSNAPDLLARMIVRAASADTQGGSAAASADGAANASAASAAATADFSAASPSTLAARFAALVAEASAGNVPSSASSSSTSSNSGHSFDQSFAQQSPTGDSGMNAVAPTVSLAANVQDALQQSAPSGPTVDANHVVEQMINSMTMRTLAQGSSEIRLQLQPENLGQVTMRLTVSGSQVSANVVAQNADVGNALVAGHRELARSLGEAGLTLSGFSVDVSGGDAGSDQSKDRTAGFGRRYVVHEMSDGNAAAETTETSSIGPSILAGSRLELFNSLA